MGLWFNTVRLILLWMCIGEISSTYLIAHTEWSDLFSPNYPHKYPNDADEMYEVLVPGYHNMVCIKAATFDLELSENCTRDSVSVQDSLLSQPLGYWCGRHMPSMCSETGEMYIRFRSDDNNVTGYGFHIMYREKVREAEDEVPVVIVIAMCMIPLSFLGILMCDCRRKKRFNNPMHMEGLDNRGSSTQTPVTESSCNVASISHPPEHIVNQSDPPSYESSVGCKVTDLPPSYESIVTQGDNNT